MPIVIRNILIRIVAVFEQIWNFLMRQFGKVWGFVSRLFGLTETGYFLDAENTASNQQISSVSSVKPSLEPKPSQIQANSSSNTPSRSTAPARSANSDMNYFRDMARQIKKK